MYVPILKGREDSQKTYYVPSNPQRTRARPSRVPEERTAHLMSAHCAHTMLPIATFLTAMTCAGEPSTNIR